MIPFLFSFSGDEIQYVSVEIIEKTVGVPTVTNINKGLFAGISKYVASTNNLFLSLQQENGIFLTSNLNRVNVISIEIGHGAFKEELFFQNVKTDQEKALDALREILIKLSTTDKMKNENEIDTSKYVTDKTNSAGNSRFPINKHDKSLIGISDERTMHRDICGYSSVKNIPATVLKKDDGPTLLKRKTALPAKNRLDELREKLSAIKDNSYKEPPLKLICNKDKKEIDPEEWEGDTTTGYNNFYC